MTHKLNFILPDENFIPLEIKLNIFFINQQIQGSGVRGLREFLQMHLAVDVRAEDAAVQQTDARHQPPHHQQPPLLLRALPLSPHQEERGPRILPPQPRSHRHGDQEVRRGDPAGAGRQGCERGIPNPAVVVFDFRRLSSDQPIGLLVRTT